MRKKKGVSIAKVYSRCINCQRQPDTTVTSFKNGRRKIIEAAAVRKGQVLIV